MGLKVTKIRGPQARALRTYGRTIECQNGVTVRHGEIVSVSPTTVEFVADTPESALYDLRSIINRAYGSKSSQVALGHVAARLEKLVAANAETELVGAAVE